MSRILSGIRASGDIHLGIYLGAMQQWINLQDDHEVFFMVADLHGITTPYDPKTLPQLVRHAVIDYLAAGLDPKKATIFIQSHVPAHSELMWLFNTITPIGELQRMVQFKEKAAANKEYNNAGLMNYPILMAADILAYKADQVPVGDDQGQHVELARDIAKKFNRMFGQTFPEPKAMFGAGKRIMSLTDPEAKMSKSEGTGIGLNDNPDMIAAKVKKAVSSAEPKVIRDAFQAAAATKKTAVGEWRGDPNLVKQFHGVRNLFTILLSLRSKADIAKWKTAAEDGRIQFSEFKPALAKIIADHFAPFRLRRAQLVHDRAYVDDVLKEGAAKANAAANATLLEVQMKMGLRS